MIRLIGFSMVGALMAGQLLLLSNRNVFVNHSKDYPRMALPAATNATLYSGPLYENISWTQAGGWVGEGNGSIKENDLDDFLRGVAERSKARGDKPGLRVRIPANASAGIIVNLTKRMESAGVEVVRVVVVDLKRPWL